MTWVAHVSGAFFNKNRVLAPEYLQARGDAWDRGQFDDGTRMDPVITDFRDDDNRDVMLWLAFMAGTIWERQYRGRRYADESTGAI